MKKINFITIITTVFITTLSAQPSQKRITLDDIFRDYKFIPSGIPQIESMNNGEHFTTLIEGSRIEQYSYKTGEKTATVFDLKLLTDPPFNRIAGYEFSGDEQKILIPANRQNIYRHSFMADYYIYERSKDSIYLLSGRIITEK